jgi:hypothetical protein
MADPRIKKSENAHLEHFGPCASRQRDGRSPLGIAAGRVPANGPVVAPNADPGLIDDSKNLTRALNE